MKINPRPPLCHRLLVTALALSLLSSCTGVPEGVSVVTEFEVERYLGTWYEIARLDHSFERHLSNVSATYSRGENGEILVVVNGFCSCSF